MYAIRSYYGRTVFAAEEPEPEDYGKTERPILVALAGDGHDDVLLGEAAVLARTRSCPVNLLHVRSWEVIDDQAVELESTAKATQLLGTASIV